MQLGPWGSCTQARKGCCGKAHQTLSPVRGEGDVPSVCEEDPAPSSNQVGVQGSGRDRPSKLRTANYCSSARILSGFVEVFASAMFSEGGQ